VDKSVAASWRSVAATPPLAGLAGATVAALNTYKKIFLKNKKLTYQTSQIVQKCQLHQLNLKPYENEAGDSHNQGPRVDRLRH
jgi:hypothetical protein